MQRGTRRAVQLRPLSTVPASEVGVRPTGRRARLALDRAETGDGRKGDGGHESRASCHLANDCWSGRRRGRVGSDLAVELEAQRAAIGGQAARQKTGPAGYDFQEEVHSAVRGILLATDDEVEMKGRAPGATGGAEGDIVVTIDPALTNGVTARVSVEATKSATKLTGPAIKAMLAKGKADRSAQAAVLVLRDPKAVGGHRLVEYPGLGVAAVFEPNDPEEFRSLAITVALKQARAMAIRVVKPSAAERNDAEIERACSDAKAALDAVDKVIGNQAQIVKFAENTTTVATELRRRVLNAVAGIDEALAG